MNQKNILRRFILICLSLSATVVFAQQSANGDDWPAYAADTGSTKYSPLDQINAANVGQLEIVWRRPALDPYYLTLNPSQRITDNCSTAPVVINGVGYIPNGVGLVEAFDGVTGTSLWLQQPFEGPEDLPGTATGDYVRSFGSNGRVSLQVEDPNAERYRWGGVPMVVGDVVVIGQSMNDTFANKEGSRGDVRAYDVRSGALRWVYHTVPMENEFGTETWQDRSWSYTGNASVWSLFSADADLGLVYLPITSSTNDMYGGHRIGDDLFSQSLVAVDAATGRRVWHYQLVHHGLWDYDPPAAPILMDITVDGRPVKAIAQITKQAFTYVFDRVTGEPVWDIIERPVPQSNVPGEVTSPTQPFPTRPAPFDRQGSTEDNLIDFTPQLHAEALEIVSHFVTGPVFTPPSIAGDGPGDTGGTIQLPGSQGGADVQGAAFDPETGYLYIPSITAPFIADLFVGDPDSTNLRYTKGTRRLIAGPQGLPLMKPPYGGITAIDMNRGEHVWMVPNGDGPRDHPAIAHLNLGKLGVPGRPSPLLTRTLLFIGEGRTNVPRDGRVPADMPREIAMNSGGPMFRAYDKATGDVVWETELEAGTTGAPISYMQNGRQYLVVAIGDREHQPELVTSALPE